MASIISAMIYKVTAGFVVSVARIVQRNLTSKNVEMMIDESP